jgi:hypothetical protein
MTILTGRLPNSKVSLQTLGDTVDAASDLAHLIDSLASVPSQSWISSCAARLVAFAALGQPTEAALSYVEALTPEQRNSLFNGSHETSTHYKWLIYRTATPCFTLWLHEYRTKAQNAVGYAQVPHNHRYDIASLILTGSYAATTWKTSNVGLAEANRNVFKERDVMALSHEQIHSLSAIQQGTLTLVVEGPRIKGFSLAYYPDEQEPRIIPDFATRWPNLKTRLRAKPQ